MRKAQFESFNRPKRKYVTDTLAVEVRLKLCRGSRLIPFTDQHYLSLRRRRLHRVLLNLRANFVATTLKRLEARQTLDIGSSSGEELHAIQNRLPGLSLVGLERSSSQLAAAASPLRCVCADARALPFGGASFDSVVMLSTMKHIFRLPQALAEIRRVLQPGGHLVIVEPGAAIIRFGAHLGYFDRKNIANLWDVEESRRQLAANHFDPIAWGRFGLGLYQFVMAKSGC